KKKSASGWRETARNDEGIWQRRLPRRADEETSRLAADQAFHFQDRQGRENSWRLEAGAGDDLVLMNGIGGDQVQDVPFDFVERQFPQAVHGRRAVRTGANRLCQRTDRG